MLEISRQRKWQIRKQKEGLCTICGQKAVTKTYCERHAALASVRVLKKYYAKKPKSPK